MNLSKSFFFIIFFLIYSIPVFSNQTSLSNNNLLKNDEIVVSCKEIEMSMQGMFDRKTMLFTRTVSLTQHTVNELKKIGVFRSTAPKTLSTKIILWTDNKIVYLSTGKNTQTFKYENASNYQFYDDIQKKFFTSNCKSKVRIDKKNIKKIDSNLSNLKSNNENFFKQFDKIDLSCSKIEDFYQINDSKINKSEISINVKSKYIIGRVYEKGITKYNFTYFRFKLDENTILAQNYTPWSYDKSDIFYIIYDDKKPNLKILDKYKNVVLHCKIKNSKLKKSDKINNNFNKEKKNYNSSNNNYYNFKNNYTFERCMRIQRNSWDLFSSKNPYYYAPALSNQRIEAKKYCKNIRLPPG